MEPGLDPDGRVVVRLLDDDGRARISRGDVVVFADPGTWTDHAGRTALGAPEHGAVRGPAPTYDDVPATVVVVVVVAPGSGKTFSIRQLPPPPS